MKQSIRWSGLGAFIVIVAGIASISLLFLDTWIKLGAEKGLGSALGAEVNISEVSHTLSPFSVTLSRLQFTDPAQPQNNKVQAETLSADVEILPLLMQKVVINNLQVTGVEFDQERSKPGEVYRQPDAKQSFIPSFDEGDVELPDIDDLIAKSPLKTTKAIADAEAAYALHKTQLEAQYKALPNKEKLENYKQQIEALKETDYKNPAELLAAKEKFEAIKQEIRADKKQFEDFKNAVGEAKADLSPKVAALRAAPGEDYEQLKGLAAGDAAAISDVTAMIFGEQTRAWSEKLLAAVELVGPMLQNNKEQAKEEVTDAGRWYEFTDTTPLPDLLIRNANISVKWEENAIDSIWKDITNDHTKLGRATTFSVDAEKTSLWQKLALNGDLWIDDLGIKANQAWQLAGLALQPSDMVKEDKLSVALTSALLNSAGKLSINQNILDGTGKIDLGSLQLDAQGSNKLTNIIADSLNQLSDLSIDTDISGNLSSPSLGFKSDLDKKLSQAISGSVSKEAQAKLGELQAKLDKQAGDAIGTNDQQLAQLVNWEQLADGNLSSIDGLLKSKLDSVVDKKKDELKEKLLKKLKF
ncbi:TIGR03545 family protein [Alteromonadaceae bacterium M269]|nr:TIGR03545 family protein [Alteromonadaceae bacterium M269]